MIPYTEFRIMGITMTKAPGGLNVGEVNSSVELFLSGLPSHPVAGEPYIPSGTTFTFINGFTFYSGTTTDDIGATFVDDLANQLILWLEPLFFGQYNVDLIDGSGLTATIGISAVAGHSMYNFASFTLPTGIIAQNNTPYNPGTLAYGVFVKNDYDFVFQTDKYLVAAPTFAFLDLIISGVGTNGQTIEIGNTVISETFTLSNSSGTVETNDNYVLVGSSAFSQASNLVTAFKQNYKLDTLYRISIVSNFPNPTIRLQGRTTSSLALHLLNSPTNISEDTDTTDPVPTGYAPNYRMFLDLYLPNETLIAPLDGIPSDDQKCVFKDINKLLKSLCGKNIPAISSSFALTDLNNYQYFYIKACDYYGSPPSGKKYKAFPSNGRMFIALNGAAAQNRITDDYLVPYFSQTVKFLTTMPNGNIYVSPDQHQFLSFFYSTLLTANLWVKLRLYYSDGTFSDWETIVVDHFSAQRIFTLNVGYSQLNIDSLKESSKIVLRYAICVFKDNTNTEAFTEEFVFKVDHNHFRYSRYFLFLNSFGQPETLWMTGVQDSNIDIEAAQYSHPYSSRDESRSIYNGNTSDGEVQFDNKYKQASGFRKRWELDYVKDFFSSETKYLQLQDRYQSILLGKGKIDLGGEDDTTFKFEFTYQTAIAERGNA